MTGQNRPKPVTKMLTQQNPNLNTKYSNVLVHPYSIPLEIRLKPREMIIFLSPPPPPPTPVRPRVRRQFSKSLKIQSDFLLNFKRKYRGLKTENKPWRKDVCRLVCPSSSQGKIPSSHETKPQVTQAL